MSFNLDDPLAGILSDGSDDSFFDDDILGKKKPTKKKTTPLADKKNALFDLSASSNEKSKLQRAEEKRELSASDFNVDKPKPPSPATFSRTLSKDSIKVQSSDSKGKSDSVKIGIGKSPVKTKAATSVDSLDILGDLMPETKPTKPLERGKSSQSLFDDILGGSSTKTGGSSQQARPVTAAKSQGFDFESFLEKNESKQTISSSKTTVPKATSKEAKKEPSTKAKTSDDWLGIFQKEEEDNEDDIDMPAWLAGGDKAKKSAKSEDKPVAKPKQKIEEKVEHNEPVEKEKEYYQQFDSKLEQLSKIGTSNNVLQASNDDITTEGAQLYMQQQEAQLMVALQLKAQEEKLAAMQMRQKETQRVQREATLAHQAQVDAMLARQAEHRRQMQAVISAHQDRITQRIQALLGTADVNSDGLDMPDGEQQNPSTERRESPHVKEKKQLLQLVQSLQENHDKEIDLMETSYRRQLAFLEISLSQSEERMKDESDKLTKFYSEKINWLEEHHALYKKLVEDNLSSLTDRHKAENEILRQQHIDNVRVLQEHHASLMENIKNAVKQEHTLIQDSTGFSSNLQELVNDIKETKTQCIMLVEKIEAVTGNTKHDNEKSLQIRESQINEMIHQLKKERDNFDIEKSESRDMVKMLETRLKQMTTSDKDTVIKYLQMIEDETALLKQKRMEFEFEKATFNKQTEFAKNVLKRQDEEIKLLKEDIQKEYKEKIAKIEEDKQKAQKDSAMVAKEKASTQSLKQEIEKLKTDLQAQLEEVTEERSRLNIEKQQMHMEEQRILAKSRDLDLLAKTAIEKQSQADKKYSEAEFIQKKYEERIRRIQEHVVSLNNREKQIAKEKVALSRERLNLHNERKQLEGKQQCSLCRSAQNAPQYNFDTAYLPETFLQMPVSRDFAGTNVNSAMTAIEQDMAQLMGQTFGLRHTPGLVTDREDRSNANNVRDGDIVRPTDVETGSFKDYMDPKLMMLRLDVQQVISNLDQNKTDQVHLTEDEQKEK